MLEEQRNYRTVLKSTTLIGGSSFINIIVGMVKTKFIAILIGPTGVGLMGVMNSMTGIVGTVTGMGLNSSGVRQVADSVGKADDDKISRTVISVRRIVWITGFIGLLVMVVGSPYLSRASFGNNVYTIPIAFLGLSVFFSAMGSGQSCVLQGFRRIPDLARVGIIGSISGILIGVPCYYVWGKNGIVPSLILCSAAMLATSWWFARRVTIKPIVVSWHDSKDEIRRLLGLGLPIMLAGLIATVNAYLINVYLTRKAGLEAVGFYQAAFSLSGILVNFILGAMGTDYYPRLTAVADDNERINTEVNIQTEIGLLLAVPAIALTVVLMPLAVKIFYSGRFEASIEILRWAVFGALGRVVSWPLAYIILAKGKGKFFFATEVIAGGFNLLFFWLGYRFWGLSGTGLGFALLYFFYSIFMLIVVYKIAQVRWTKSVFWQVLVYSIILIVLSIVCTAKMNSIVKWGVGGAIVVGVSGYNIKRIQIITGFTVRKV